MIEAIQVRGVVKSAFARITIMGLLAGSAGVAAFAQEAGNTLEGISAQALRVLHPGVGPWDDRV